MHQYAQAACSLAPVVAYDLIGNGTTWKLQKPQACCTLQQALVRPTALTPKAKCPRLPSLCGLQNPHGSYSKVYVGQLGSGKTVNQKIQKSALMLWNAAQLAVLTEHSFE